LPIAAELCTDKRLI